MGYKAGLTAPSATCWLNITNAADLHIQPHLLALGIPGPGQGWLCHLMILV